jgi:hypothetical protein
LLSCNHEWCVTRNILPGNKPSKEVPPISSVAKLIIGGRRHIHIYPKTIDYKKNNKAELINYNLYITSVKNYSNKTNLNKASASMLSKYLTTCG